MRTKNGENVYENTFLGLQGYHSSNRMIILSKKSYIKKFCEKHRIPHLTINELQKHNVISLPKVKRKNGLKIKIVYHEVKDLSNIKIAAI